VSPVHNDNISLYKFGIKEAGNIKYIFLFPLNFSAIYIPVQVFPDPIL
jgi:hypothetical protein